MKKKYIKNVIVFAILICLGLYYFFYISNKMPQKDAIDSSVTNAELSRLLTLDIDSNYPQSPKEVLKLYLQYNQEYYKSDVSKEQLEKLAKQVIKLFDPELLRKQTDVGYIEAVKADVDSWKSAGRYISDYEIGDNSRVEYKTLYNQEYAILPMRFFIRQGSELTYAYHSFRFRKDASGRWKILYWEATKQVELGRK